MGLVYFQNWIRSGPWHEPNTGKSLKAIFTIESPAVRTKIMGPQACTSALGFARLASLLIQDVNLCPARRMLTFRLKRFS